MFKILKNKIKTILKKNEINIFQNTFLNLFLCACSVGVVFSYNIPGLLLGTLFSIGTIYLYFIDKESKLNTKKLEDFLLNNDKSINSMIIKKFIIEYLEIKNYLDFYLNNDKEFTKSIKKEIEKEIEIKEPFLNKIKTLKELKEYIRINEINLNDLLNIVNNELPFIKNEFMTKFEINNILEKDIIDNKELIKKNSLDLLSDNTILSNEINKVINLYKKIELNQSKLDMNEKIELNKISNTLEKIIMIFTEIKELKNKEIEDNLILLINELNSSMEHLNQSIQNTIVKDIKVLSKTFKLKN